MENVITTPVADSNTVCYIQKIQTCDNLKSKINRKLLVINIKKDATETLAVKRHSNKHDFRYRYNKKEY